MTHFTKYAEQKFEILNAHEVFYTREQIEDVVNAPTEVKKSKKHSSAIKDNIKVIYKQQMKVKRIITFFPVKYDL